VETRIGGGLTLYDGVLAEGPVRSEPADLVIGSSERETAAGPVLIGGGICDSLNRVKSCLLASSFLARAAAVSKANRAGFLPGSIGRADSVAPAALPLLEPALNVWPELDV
jgi:hypothetical protein